MKSIVSLLCLCFALQSNAQQKPAITNKDITGLQGNWEGKLVYTDYHDDKTSVTLPAKVGIKESADSLLLEYTYTEPNGKDVKDKANLRLMSNNTVLVYDGQENDVLGVHRRGDRLIIITGREGTDNNKEAQIRETFTIGPSVFIILKEVMYGGMTKYFTRNQLTLNRK